MPRYVVHVYAITRLTLAASEAPSPEAAARQAEQGLDLHQLAAAGRLEYADQIEGFLVDMLDDRGERIDGRSVFLDPNGDPLRD